MSDPQVKSLIDKFIAAWEARDTDQVMECFASDAMYYASIGPLPGTRAEGRDAIRDLVLQMFETDAGASTRIGTVLIAGDQVAWSWIYSFPDGSQELGCDLISIKRGKIVVKDAYRKIKSIS